MTIINREEYEVLKELDDKWKWIVRNDEWQLEVRKDKPFKKGHVWSEEVTNHSFSNDIDLGSFHFIQWNDINGHEEPYNIAELIEEYEDSKEYKDSLVIEYFMDKEKESEETEVKSKQELIEEWESAIEAAEFYGKGKEERLISYMKDFVSDLNQLDEPEVLSQEWIDENQELQFYVANDTAYYFVRSTHLQNLLVPKQELPVIPQFVADCIESAGSNRESNKEYVIRSIIDQYYERNFEPIVYDWFGEKGNLLKFYRAVDNGYTVEEEQKYYALVKGHEIMGKSAIKFWNYSLSGSKLVVSSIGETREYGTQLTKDEWNEMGVNDGNADFVKVEELEE